MLQMSNLREFPPRGVPNMKFPRRNGGGNFYKWLPWGAVRAGGLFSVLFTDTRRAHITAECVATFTTNTLPTLERNISNFTSPKIKTKES